MDKRTLTTFSLLAAICCMGCNGKSDSGSASSPAKPAPELKKSAAIFDAFTYVGNDDYYNQNPLPDENSFYNPILPGWYSDPSICSDGKDFYMVTSTFSYFPGVPVFKSSDLVNWQQIGYVLTRESQLPLKGQGVSGGIFAPAISYNKHNGLFYMITTNVGAGNFFVTASDPAGPWSEPTYLPNVGGIDPSLFFDDDGKAYIVNNDEPEGPAEYDGHRAIRVHEFDVATGTTSGRGKVLVNKGVNPDEKPIWIEGPHMYKINGKYMLMSAEGGTGPQHSEVLFTSDSPMGPFTPIAQNPILTQRHLDPSRPNPITCAGHADLVEDADGNWWAVFLACRPIDNTFENLGRETFIIPVRWTADGLPYMTEGDELVPMIVRKEGAKLAEGAQNGNFSVTEDFDADRLPLDWLTLRTAATDLYSIDNSYLTLTCHTSKVSQKETPAFVCRRIQHHKFECSTQMFFDPEEGEKAGLILYKDETHFYFLAVAKADGKKTVKLLKSGIDDGLHTLQSFDLPDNQTAVGLKVTSAGKTFSFYYSTSAEEWKEVDTDVDAGYLSTAVAGGFTGTTVGLYAVKD